MAKCNPGCTCKRHVSRPNPKLAEANRNKIWTQEARDKLSELKTGVPNPAVSRAQKGRKWSKEKRQRHSEILKLVPHTPEWNVKVSESLIGKSKAWTPEWREKIRLGVVGRKYSEETKQVWKRAAKRRYENPEYREKILHHLSRIQRPTHIEIILGNFLNKAFPEYEIISEHRIKIPKRECRVDFAIPSEKLVFEADGEYWHRDKERDAKRDKELEKLGWIVFRFTGKEIVSWIMSN